MNVYEMYTHRHYVGFIFIFNAHTLGSFFLFHIRGLRARRAVDGRFDGSSIGAGVYMSVVQNLFSQFRRRSATCVIDSLHPLPLLDLAAIARNAQHLFARTFDRIFVLR